MNVDDTLGGLLGSRVPPHRRDITVRHLLTMTGGSAPLEDFRGLEPANWLDFLLDRPQVAAPGTVFAYDNAVYDGSPVFLASGFAGQQVCIAPEAGVTVVLTASRERYLANEGGDNREVLPDLVAWAAA